MTEAESKTVYLIRHAESEENHRIASLFRSFGSLGRLTLPSSSDVGSAMSLINIPAQIDSEVSEIGSQQILQLAEKLKKDNFLIEKKIEMVAHSPLKRARQTSKGMLGCMTPDDRAETVKRVEELDLLREKTPSEWIPGGIQSLNDRMANFETWLGEQPESTFAIVGHSQYFKAMLKLDFKFGNCDVWEVKYDKNSEKTTGCTVEGKDYELPVGWSGLKRLYTYEMPATVPTES